LLTQGDGLIGAYDNYDSYDSYGDDGVTLGTILAVYAGFFVFTLIVTAIAYVLTAIPLAALFRKTGIEPWKAWVPLYSTYEWLRLGGQNGHWVWLSLVPYGSIATAVFLYMGMYRTGKAFGKEGGFLVLGIFLPVVWLFLLGFGSDEYHPERITAAGLGAPRAGYGAVPDGAAVVPSYPPQQPGPPSAF
jgi:hypothetical protein